MQATDKKPPSPDPEKPTLDPKTQKLKERMTRRKQISKYSLFNRLFFFWVSPLVSFCNKSKKLEFDMMNNLEIPNYYENYSNKIDYYFEKHKKKYLKSKSPNPRTFHLKLILSTFKWDYLLQFFCGFCLSFFNYFSSFIIQQIFALQYYDISSQEKLKWFGIYIGMMIAAKVVYIISNVHLNFVNIEMGLKTFYTSSHLVLKKSMKTSFIQNWKYNMGEIINLGIGLFIKKEFKAFL